ncbi:MAG: hypothetical protein P4L99_21650 [Chthoniobacter sp.]|nr:hypothetical protein [Chthoniobacter sp.]
MKRILFSICHFALAIAAIAAIAAPPTTTTPPVTPAGAQTLTNKTYEGYTITGGTGTLNFGGGGTVTFVDITTNAQTGTSYTFVLGDDGKRVDMSNASANTVTVPPNSSVAFPVGAQILVRQGGAGVTTIAAGAGVTIHNATGVYTLAGQYSYVTLIKTATDTWDAIGSFGPLNLTAPYILLTNASGAQMRQAYDGSNYVDTTVNSDGSVAYNQVGTGKAYLWGFNSAGGIGFQVFETAAQINGTNCFFAVGNTANVANRPRFVVNGYPPFGSGSGVGDGGADNQVAICINLSDKYLFDATRLTLHGTSRLVPVHVSALPASPAAGDTAAVDDATSTTYGATAVGSGSNFDFVVYDGTNWIIH